MVGKEDPLSDKQLNKICKFIKTNGIPEFKTKKDFKIILEQRKFHK